MRAPTCAFLFLPLIASGPSASGAETLRLANGDELNGLVIRRTDTTVYFEHPQLGRLELAQDQLVAFSPPRERQAVSQSTGDAGALPGPEHTEQPSPAEGEAPAEDERWWDPQRGGLLGTPLLRGWDNRLGLGLSGSSGGFEDTKFSLLFKTGTRNDRRRWIFDGTYFLSITPETDDQPEEVSKNQALVLLRRDSFGWIETWPKGFLFTQSRYQFDEFQPWKHRWGAHLGPGYPVIDGERWKLILRLGVGASYAWGDLQRLQPEGLGAFDVEWRVNAWNSVFWRNEFVLDFSDTENTRTVQSLDWQIDLSRGAGLGFKVGMLYTFDSQSEGKANDLTYLGSLTYDF